MDILRTMRSRETDNLHRPVREHIQKDFFAFPVTSTVTDVLQTIREKDPEAKISYFYVIDESLRLLGVIPTRRLLYAGPDRLVSDIMISHVITIDADETVLRACDLFARHRFLALPVVDKNLTLMGVIEVSFFANELVDLSKKRALDDLFESIGFRVSQAMHATPWKGFRLRFPWLAATLLSGMACAIITSFFTQTLSQSLILVFFFTLILGLGESVSVQSLSLAIQSFHGKKPTWRAYQKALRRELPVAILLGLVCGILVAGGIILWKQAFYEALILAVSIIFLMITACVMGLTVPTILHALKLNIRIAAGPITLALTDIFTLTFYLGFAVLILNR